MLNRFKFVLALSLIVVMSSVGDASGSDFLGLLQQDPFSVICHRLDPESLTALGQTSKGNRGKVNTYRKSLAATLVNQMNTMQPQLTGRQMFWYLDRLEGKAISPQLQAAIENKRIAEENKRIADGFFFVPQGSPLSFVLPSISAVDEIKAMLINSNRLNDLFTALFGCPMPEEKDDALNQLMAIMPIIHLGENGDTDLIQRLIGQFAAMRERQPYYCFDVPGADTKALQTTPHIIVVNQSQLSTRMAQLNEILQPNHPHTLVINILRAPQNGVLSMSRDDLPRNVGKLVLRDPNGLIKSLEDEFLSGCKSLAALDTSGLRNVTTVGDYFLIGCTSLAALDTSGLRNVTTVGGGFLYGCTSLAALDTRCLRKVITVGDYFLIGCTSLAALDTSGLRNVTTVGGCFLYGCTSLAALDTSGLRNVTTVGFSFLSGCKSLVALDTSGLRNVTTVGGCFLYGCTSLAALDTSGLRNVTTVGGYFLSDCKSLAALDTSGLRNVTTVGGCFLYGCTSLAALDISGLRNVTTVGDSFLSDCKSLAALDTSGLRNVTTVGFSFLLGCTNLPRDQIDQLMQDILARQRKD